MISAHLQTKVEILYNTYNYTLKPLLATVEARFEKFPLPVINEIRAFNDHIAQCYREDVDDEYRDNQIPDIHRARTRFRIRRFLKFLGWLAAAILSGVVSGLLFGG